MCFAAAWITEHGNVSTFLNELATGQFIDEYIVYITFVTTDIEFFDCLGVRESGLL